MLCYAYVTVPWSVCVCLSVCQVRVLCSNGRRFRQHLFISSAYDSPMALSDRVKIWLTSATLSSPTVAPKRPTPCWFELRRHSTANCGRMVRESAMVTMEPIGDCHRCFEWYLRWPLTTSPNRDRKCTAHEQLRDTCCHLANMIEERCRLGPCFSSMTLMRRLVPVIWAFYKVSKWISNRTVQRCLNHREPPERETCVCRICQNSGERLAAGGRLVCIDMITRHTLLNLWHPLLPYGYSYRASRAKPTFVIFDIRALWRSWLSIRVPGCQKLQMTA